MTTTTKSREAIVASSQPIEPCPLNSGATASPRPAAAMGAVNTVPEDVELVLVDVVFFVADVECVVDDFAVEADVEVVFVVVVDDVSTSLPIDVLAYAAPNVGVDVDVVVVVDVEVDTDIHEDVDECCDVMVVDAVLDADVNVVFVIDALVYVDVLAVVVVVLLKATNVVVVMVVLCVDVDERMNVDVGVNVETAIVDVVVTVLDVFVPVPAAAAVVVVMVGCHSQKMGNLDVVLTVLDLDVLVLVAIMEDVRVTLE